MKWAHAVEFLGAARQLLLTPDAGSFDIRGLRDRIASARSGPGVIVTVGFRRRRPRADNNA